MALSSASPERSPVRTSQDFKARIEAARGFSPRPGKRVSVMPTPEVREYMADEPVTSKPAAAAGGLAITDPLEELAAGAAAGKAQGGRARNRNFVSWQQRNKGQGKVRSKEGKGRPGAKQRGRASGGKRGRGGKRGKGAAR